jgi:G3E family GTPase
MFDLSIPEDVLVVSAIALILLSGSTILLMDHESQSRRKRLCLALTQGFWKFKPVEVDEAKDRQMNWMRVQLAGVMVACTTVSMSAKALKVRGALAVAGAVFAAWSALVWLAFAHFGALVAAFRRSTGSGDGDAAADGNGAATAGWKARLKRHRAAPATDDTAAPAYTADPAGEIEDRRLPVTIITGFLGSGKTTMVKRILDNTVGLRVLVVENEIGAEGIDHELLLQHVNQEEVILMNNGCICCTVRKDLIGTFHKLFADPAVARLDWVVLETTGLADPAPLIQSLYMDPACNAHLRLDGVLTIVDAVHLPLHLPLEAGSSNGADGDGDKGTPAAAMGVHGGAPEAVQQIVFADRVIVNKIDLLEDDERLRRHRGRGRVGAPEAHGDSGDASERLEAVVAAVRRLNPSVDVVCCKYANVPVEALLNIRAFDPAHNAALLKKHGTASDSGFASGSGSGSGGGTGGGGGFIRYDADGKIVPGGTRGWTSSSSSFSSSSSAVRVATSGDATADVGTVSLVSELPLDLDTFNLWLAALLRTEGPRIYRLKGILAMRGYDRQFVAHGVHMIFDGELGPLWPDAAGRAAASAAKENEAPSSLPKDIPARGGVGVRGGGGGGVGWGQGELQRRSRLVLIGKDLDVKKLQQGFAACVAVAVDDDE